MSQWRQKCLAQEEGTGDNENDETKLERRDYRAGHDASRFCLTV